MGDAKTGGFEQGSASIIMIEFRVYLGGIVFASLIEMWAAGTTCDQLKDRDGFNCDKEFGWAVAVGVISCAVCCTMLIIDLIKGRFCADKISDTLWKGIHMTVGIILAVLWVGTVAVCTFEKPFAGISSSVTYGENATSVGGATACTGGQNSNAEACSANGYLSTWIATAATLGYMLKATPFLHNLAQKIPKDGPKQLLSILFASSGLVLWHSSYWCYKINDNKMVNGQSPDNCKCDGVLLYGVIVSVFSCVVTLVFTFIPKLGPFLKYYAAFSVVWWFCGVGALTFKSGKSSCSCWDCGVFYEANNGFFGTWVSFFTSFALVGATWDIHMSDTGDKGAEPPAAVVTEVPDDQAQPAGVAVDTNATEDRDDAANAQSAGWEFPAPGAGDDAAAGHPPDAAAGGAPPATADPKPDLDTAAADDLIDGVTEDQV